MEVEVIWRGPACKHSVVRKADKVVIKEGFSDKADAQRYADEYVRMIAATPLTVIKRGAPKLLDASLQRAGHFRASYEAIIPHGTSLDEVQSASYWANVARRMRQFDLVSCLAEDGSWYAELLVSQIGTGFAKVALLFAVDLSEPEEAQEQADTSAA